MAETLKNGRYEQRTEWKDASNGRVARFWDTNTHKEVFVKEFFKLRYPAQTTTPDGRVLPSLVRAEKRVDRFCEKTRAINAKINEIAHAGGDVVVTTDFFREGLYIYKVSELIPLEDWAGVEVRDHLSVEQIDTLMQRLANALQTLHSAGVLHCDLKPENIFIVKDRDGFYVGMLSDFDDSFMMDNVPHSDDIVCTLAYMSPELGHYKSMEADTPELPLGTASDVFALGLIYHEYLAGEFPSFDEDYSQLFAALLQGEPLELSKNLDPAHRMLLYRMMVTLPYDRIQTCADVSREIANIRRRYKAEFTLTVDDGRKPLAGQTVVLYGHFKADDPEAERQSVPLAAARTDKNGRVTFKGLTDYEYSVVVDDAELPVVWEGQGANKYACTVSTATVQKYQLTVTSDGHALPNAVVKVALLNEARKPVKVFTGRTDSSGVCEFEDLQEGIYRASVGSVAKNFKWNSACKAVFAIQSYTLQLMNGDQPAADTAVELVGMSGGKAVRVELTSDHEGRSVHYNLNTKLDYIVRYNGREFPVVWENFKATVQLVKKTRLVAGVRMADTKEPVRDARIRFGRAKDGAFEELANGLTNDRGAVLLGSFPEGKYYIAVASVPAGVKLTGRQVGRLIAVTLEGEKKTVAFSAAADTENVVLDQDIPESESRTFCHIVKYRTGGTVLTKRSDGSKITVPVSQLALRGLEKYM